MRNISNEIVDRMKAIGDNEQAAHLSRFFKTGKGEYGEGDCFLGIRNPETRSIVREFRDKVELEDVEMLLRSIWHEIRLAGFLLLIELFKKAKSGKRRRESGDVEKRQLIVDYYLSVIERGNNWDLVDLVAPKILGEWLVEHPEERGVLYQLAAMDGKLWHQRVAVVSCWTIIRSGDFDDTLRLAELMLNHRHDLIHKATGWMLREVGKRGGMPRLLAFLDKHAERMPRTMLRYSIEQLPEESRRHYLGFGK